MPFKIIRDNIVRVSADAIVNTANPEPVFARGTDAAIYQAAGAEKLLAARKNIGWITPGEAAVTEAFDLDARYIIHTVGPAWNGFDPEELEVLASCYRKSLLLAEQLECRSIAFPLISSGSYGYPKELALDIALREISAFLEKSEMEVTLVVFDQEAFDLSADLIGDVESFIDEKYVETYNAEGSCQSNARPNVRPSGRSGEIGSLWGSRKAAKAEGMLESPRPVGSADAERHLEDVMKHVGETFQERLLRMIDEKGMTDVEVYKRANIDRKLFSKIRCNADYTPRKKNVLALAVALGLNMDETVDLLRSAGLALAPGNKGDLIVEYCIRNEIYDIYRINALLFKYQQQILG